MIDNDVYQGVMNEWSAPSQGCCTDMIDVISPDCAMSTWAVQKTVTILANADYYYTKDEVDKLIEEVTVSGVTRAEVEEMIQRAIATKANQADLEALSGQVQTQATQILDRYTKGEVNSLLSAYYTKLQTNSMFANYTKVDGTTLSINDENITI